MRISCSWSYVTAKYGAEPSAEEMAAGIAEMAEMGFHFIEVSAAGCESLDPVVQNRWALRDQCKQNGVEVISFAPLVPAVISPDPATKREGMICFETGVKAARDLGCSRIWMTSYGPMLQPETQETEAAISEHLEKPPPGALWREFWKHFVSAIGECNRICKDYDMVLLIEPRIGDVISNSDALLRLFDAIPDENLGAILNTAHQFAAREDLPLCVAKLGRRLRYIRAADNDKTSERKLEVETGSIDWPTLYSAISESGIDCFWAVDVDDGPDLHEKFMRSRQALEKLAGK